MRRLRPRDAVYTVLLAAVAGAILGIAGCSTSGVRALEPASAAQKSPAIVSATQAGFLPDPGRMSHDPRFPFNASWVEPGINFQDYSHVMLAPVSLVHLNPISPPNPAASNQAAALDSAIYAGDAFTRAVQNDPAHRLTQVTTPDGHTVIIALALIDLTPNHVDPTATMVGNGSNPSVTSALSAQSRLKGRGLVRMEMKLTDGASGKVIAIVSDMRRAKASAQDERLSPGYGYADDVIDQWMRDTVAMLDR